LRLVYILLALAGGLGGLSAQTTTCTFTLTATPQSFPLAGGAGTLKIVASDSSCVRTVASTVDWIVITFGQTGTGDGTAGFTVAANSDSPMRSGTITVGSQSITITQGGPPCTFAIAPTSANAIVSGGGGSFMLTGLSGCSWTASSNVPWLQITSAASGMGNATIGYAAQANSGSSARSGTISVANLTFTVNQAGQAGACVYTLSPASGSYTASGGNGTFAVSSSAGCAWTATANVPWIHITSGQSGSGSGSVAFTVDPNTGPTQRGTITVAGQTYTVTISQTNQSCSYALSPVTASLPASGGSTTFAVAAGTGCAWTAATATPWITIVSGASGSGAGVVSISAAANTGAARTGTVTAGGQSFTVMQAGAAGIQTSFIVNAANYVAGTVSPGMIVVIAAPGFGPATIVTPQLTPDGAFFTTALGQTSVLFDGVAAPMVYAVSGQISAIVPYETAGHATTQMQVTYQGQLSNTVAIPVVPSEPGLFSFDASGTGPGAILDAQFNLNSASNPAAVGSVVLLYATGEGQTAPAGADGKLAAVPLPAPLLPVTVTIDGINAPVLYAGAAPGLVAGVMQINVQIPDGVSSGARPVIVQVGQTQSQSGVTVAIQ